MFSAQVQGLDRLRSRVAGLGKQVRYASARALNSAAFDVRLAVQDKMRQVFDRPTSYILRSIWVDRAEPARLEARVRPRYLGGKGVDPAAVLQAEVLGGQRRNTRAERALQAAGILPRGFAMVPAKWVAESATHGDGNGNVKGSFIVRLLAYFNAFGEQGYRANMNDRGRKRLAKFDHHARRFLSLGAAQVWRQDGARDQEGAPKAPRRVHASERLASNGGR